jgi:hypothetical protein
MQIRYGELAYFKKVPHTPLTLAPPTRRRSTLITLHEAWKWLDDWSFVEEFAPVAERLPRVDRPYGDLDGDGFQEYRTRSPLGYENVG